MRTVRHNKSLDAVRSMPPLYHTLPGQKYVPADSEVLRWISSNMDLLEYVFGRANNTKEIIYDKESGTWRGVDYEP